MRLLLAGLFALYTGYAFAQSNCLPYAKMETVLKDKFQEEIVAAGVVLDVNLMPTGSVIEIYASPKGATWTVVETRGGQSCVKIAGRDWAQIPFVPSVLPLKQPV